ncbi:MAG: sugar phosphate nucleotidyltransferase [Solirubrobacteraceae bacterium MAG38_C4-C5]|nr:sugar phosphate nucleotidyltransferase [Candidatus Siliceabacter maunaloa]
MASRAVILAGGRGTRLAPYTTVLPKPLMPVGDRAILEIVIEQLAASGVEHLTLAVGHLAHLIEAVVGGGERHGLRIDYHRETEPLGTAGALATIDALDDTFLVMNGDILTTLDYGALCAAHSDAGNWLTIASHRRVQRTDFGVLHTDGSGATMQRLVGYEEKPEHTYTVSMGIYVAEPEVLDRIVQNERLDIPDLAQALLAAGEPVGTYLYDGYWLDIGRPDDYERASAEWPAASGTPGR